MGPVMYVISSFSCYGLQFMDGNNSGRPSYDKIISYIKKAKDAGDEVLIGGSGMLVFAFSLCCFVVP